MLPDAAGFALVVIGAAAIAYLHLRQVGLAVLAVLAPLAGVAALVTLTSHLSWGRAEAAPLAWLFGFGLATLFADEFVLELLDGKPAGAAAWSAVRARGRAQLAATLIALTACLLPLLLPGQGLSSGALVLALFGAVLGCGAMAAVALFAYGEAFIARSNRAREIWQRLFDLLIAVARPRWGFSVTGIGLVFAVLAVFGARPLVLAPALQAHLSVVAALAALSCLAIVALAIRDWRAALACLLALGLAGAVGLWGFARLGAPFGAAQLSSYGLGLSLAAMPLLAAGIAAGRFGRDGDDATIAAARTLVRLGPGALFVSLGAVAGLLLWAVSAGGTVLALAAMAGFGGAGALLFQPAFAIVIETLLPRPATRAGRYRLG